MNIGDRIRELRQALGLSQTEFAERLGKTRRTIQHWESGNITPPDNVLRLIEQTFSVNPEWLRHGKGEMFRPKNEAFGADPLEIVAERIVDRIIKKRGIKISEEKRRKVVKKLAELIEQVGEKEALDLIDIAV